MNTNNENSTPIEDSIPIEDCKKKKIVKRKKIKIFDIIIKKRFLSILNPFSKTISPLASKILKILKNPITPLSNQYNINILKMFQFRKKTP